jgi:arsenite methyltransferase
MNGSEQTLREEFDRWAAEGRGEGMENDHLPLALPMLARMDLRADENVFDAGCGSGWLSRLIARRVTQGRVVGMDVSDEMIRHARRDSVNVGNLVFIVGGVNEIPWESHFFTCVVSVESSYYWPDPARGLHEIFRVLREGGSTWILINYYRDNPYSHQWGEKLAVPTHLLSAAEWKSLFTAAGFAEVSHANIPDPTPTPATYTGRWFRDAAELAAFRAMGALLVTGTKPGAGARPQATGSSSLKLPLTAGDGG